VGSVQEENLLAAQNQTRQKIVAQAGHIGIPLEQD
jgi:hypothetical protein